jgi:2-polyprenyl-3-methyl-5-hydroxy-6-metoxy-1,4-benzoquinol methylase
MTLSCPRCGGVTERYDDRISCEKCGVVGEWSGNLPCFTDPNSYWGEIPLDEMRRANKIAEETSWEEAVDRVVNDRVLRDYICNTERATFQYLWNLPPESEILDIGAGWGAIAAGLAEKFSRVVAVEGAWERCRFLRTRMTQMGYGNVEVICANLLELPLQGGQFDAVVLNGVLEWVGLASREGNPRDLQVAFLRRVHGLLKPGGILCVGIENRIGWTLWGGSRDHSGLRYTSLMPRKLADLWCRFQAQRYRSDVNQGYRTYTYSLPGYRKLFREAGFPKIQAYHAWNGYNCPNVLLPLDGEGAALIHFVSRQNLRGTMRGRIKAFALTVAARTGLWRQVASEYVFILGKSQNV